MRDSALQHTHSAPFSGEEDAEGLMKGSFTNMLFYEEPAGTFAQGHVFVIAPEVTGAEQETGVGYWHCDISKQDKLTWSERVYALFGLAAGTPVVRDWAVERYTEQSKHALEHVRNYAIKRKLGFILDAEIRPQGGGDRWIRVLAVPILARNGRVVGLHGLKRPL
jgi:hypothetical protein